MWSVPRSYLEALGATSPVVRYSCELPVTVELSASRRPGKEHQCNQWRTTTGPVIVVTVIVIVKVSANKTHIY
jgi:hypothetical protein